MRTSMSRNGDTAKEGGTTVISHAANQSIRSYSTNQAYLYAMREDLADWLKNLYAVDIDVTNFFQCLENGTLLCQHANNITTCANYFINVNHSNLSIPTQKLNYNQGKFVRAASFFARDNIASFIGWCRKELSIPESIMFETNDLVLRFNEKNVILCLLEVARRGSRFGIPAPVLVQMEQDIDQEIEEEKNQQEKNIAPSKPRKQNIPCDFKSLDEMVQFILGMCTCPSQFPMIKVSDGKYKVGDSKNVIFLRILRQHVMVRVGGGWDTLEHYLNKHDPCRCQRHKVEKNVSPRPSRSVQSSSYGRQSVPSRDSSPKKKSLRGKSLSGTSELEVKKSRMGSLTLATTSINEAILLRGFLGVTNDQPQTNRLSINLSSTQPITKLRNSSVTPINPPPRTNHSLSEHQHSVFNRLSRPKSTPPIRSRPTGHQDDALLVQRNRTGAHNVKRTSQTTNSRPSTARDANPKITVNTPRTSRTTQKKATPTSTRSKSVFSSPTKQLGSTYPPKLSPTRTRTSLPTNPIEPTRNGPSMDISKSERDILAALERECLQNQASLSVFQEKMGQHTLSTSSEEDLEVALHMQANKTSRTSSSSSGAVVKPRKDKRDAPDRRSRIPTPVSHHKPRISSYEKNRRHSEDLLSSGDGNNNSIISNHNHSYNNNNSGEDSKFQSRAVDSSSRRSRSATRRPVSCDLSKSYKDAYLYQTPDEVFGGQQQQQQQRRRRQPEEPRQTFTSVPAEPISEPARQPYPFGQADSAFKRSAYKHSRNSRFSEPQPQWV